MRVQVTRSGGIAGLKLRAELETETLPEEQSRQLQELAGRLQDRGGPPPAGRPQRRVDGFVYTITFPDASGAPPVALRESETPVELRRLFDQLIADSLNGERGDG